MALLLLAAESEKQHRRDVEAARSAQALAHHRVAGVHQPPQAQADERCPELAAHRAALEVS